MLENKGLSLIQLREVKDPRLSIDSNDSELSIQSDDICTSPPVESSNPTTIA